MPDLPEWASVDDRDADRPKVDVDTHEAYPDLLRDVADHYGDDPPEKFADAVERLDPDAPTAYWAEVARQMSKMDVWVALGTMNVLVRLRDPGQRFREADLDDGRGPDQAAGGISGPREAVDHFRNVRGYVPAGVKMQ